MNTPPLTILLIGGDPSNAHLVPELLAEGGDPRCEVIHAERLADELDRLAAELFDVVLLDLGLSDNQGLEMLQQLQSQSADLPVLVLTGLDDEDAALAAVQAGAQDYLVKGEFNRKTLVRALRYAFERERAQRQIRHQALLLQNVMDAIIATDLEKFTIQSWNEGAERIYGW